MMTFLRAVFSIGVVIGWVVMMLWLALSVAQIAVEHTVVQTCAVSSPGGSAC